MDEWTDEFFLDYVELHAKTDLALFNAGDLRRLYALADVPFPDPHLPASAFRSLHYPGHIIEKARKRIRCPHYDRCPLGVARTKEPENWRRKPSI